MVDFLEIIKGRSTPGILIFDTNDRLLYSNHEASEIIPDLEKIPQEICDLCNRVKRRIERPAIIRKDDFHYAVLKSDAGILYAMRAILIGKQGTVKKPTHVMVLLEGIIEKHNIDFEKAQKKFELTKRETEVLGLVCEGLSNKEISEKLFISEYTVKDHIKNVMRKMGVASRNEIMASLK